MHHELSKLTSLGAVVLGMCSGCGSDGGGAGTDVVGSARGADHATLNGYVTLPGEVAAGNAVQVGIASPGIGAAWSGVILFGAMSSKSSLATFSITDLSASNYLVFIRVDVNGSGDFGTGDFGGYYVSGGASVLDPTNATAVAMSTGEIRRIDFSVGTIP